MEYDSFGEFLQAELKRLGWSQLELVEELALAACSRHPNTVSAYCLGNAYPNRATYRALTQVFSWPENVSNKGWALTLKPKEGQASA